MKVELIRYTPDALNLLLLTKGTRLGSDEDPSTWDEGRKAEHLQYMLGTIKSSWEFVDYVFRITGVTRAFTHQLVRTRTGSYAQETQRAVDVRGAPVLIPDGLSQELAARFEELADDALNGYAELWDRGAAPQDARGLLPTNTTTSIIVKWNLRTLHESAKTRLCTRTQGEYQDVFRAMREQVIAVHPWTEQMMNVACAADGRCAFPNYGPTGCAVWHPSLDGSATASAAGERFWNAPRAAAAPRATIDGRSVG